MRRTLTILAATAALFASASLYSPDPAHSEDLSVSTLDALEAPAAVDIAADPVVELDPVIVASVLEAELDAGAALVAPVAALDRFRLEESLGEFGTRYAPRSESRIVRSAKAEALPVAASSSTMGSGVTRVDPPSRG